MKAQNFFRLSSLRKGSSLVSPFSQHLMLLPFLGFMLLFLILPAGLGLLLSFSNYAPGQKHLMFVFLKNYQFLFKQAGFLSALRVSFIFTLVTVSAELTLGFITAYLLRHTFPGRAILRIFLLSPWLISPIANGVMWHFLFNSQTGIINVILGLLHLHSQPSPLGLRPLALVTIMLVEIWRTTPFVIFLLVPAMEGINQELSELATLEGASFLEQLSLLILPHLKPLLLILSLLLVGNALGSFESMLLLTGGGPASDTLTLGLYSYTLAFHQFNWSAGVSAAWFIGLNMGVFWFFNYWIFSRRSLA